jgi:putative solute:sodium symporter small subunit
MVRVMDDARMPDIQPRSNPWRRQLGWKGGLLALWLVVSFGAALFARDLGFTLFGAPFGVWMAGQGAVLVFIAIVWIDVRASLREARRRESAPDEPA